ncbi:unnamed protein product [Mytilus coruscus]|uniref:HAT C-terminal dimerisation domain-containing protein n=1 Tax=Mytilus coruscus TaxID=42192 RepID=A0A6J8EJM3_MYTCO|nr:unnamed protein product [Mytilus coruscus]
MPEHHTGENLSERLKSTVSEFELDGKIVSSVHDNARNVNFASEKCAVSRCSIKACSGTEVEKQPAKKQKVQRYDLWSFLLFDTEEDASFQDGSEMSLYIKERTVPDANQLEWWEENSCKFPRLSVLARQYLSIPATSVPSERIFSCAGLIVTKLRNRLSSSVIHQIIFLNKNYVP